MYDALRGFYTVLSQEGFDAFMAEQVASLPSFQPQLAGLLPDQPIDSSGVDTRPSSAQ